MNNKHKIFKINNELFPKIIKKIAESLKEKGYVENVLHNSADQEIKLILSQSAKAPQIAGESVEWEEFINNTVFYNLEKIVQDLKPEGYNEHMLLQLPLYSTSINEENNLIIINY